MIISIHSMHACFPFPAWLSGLSPNNTNSHRGGIQQPRSNQVPPVQPSPKTGALYPFPFCQFSRTGESKAPLLDSDRLGQVTREVNVKVLHHGQPVGNQLQGDDVQDTLQDVDRLGDLNRLGLAVVELLVIGVADDNGLAATGDNCR